MHGVRISEQALTLALIDDLTHLPNSRAFTARLGLRLREPDAFCLAYIRLYGLGAVNDLFGAHRGYKLLTTFADLLRENSGSGDFISRLGGDQFAMLLTGDGARATEVTQRIQSSFRQLALREAGSIGLVAAFGTVPRTERSAASRSNMSRTAWASARLTSA